eukprot:XP_020395501.1 uncharacterized protein LOC103630993 [Zea mays]
MNVDEQGGSTGMGTGAIVVLRGWNSGGETRTLGAVSRLGCLARRSARAVSGQGAGAVAPGVGSCARLGRSESRGVWVAHSCAGSMGGCVVARPWLLGAGRAGRVVRLLGAILASPWRRSAGGREQGREKRRQGERGPGNGGYQEGKESGGWEQGEGTGRGWLG